MALGRPSEFKEEYCEMLVEHLSKGLSFSSFAGVIGVCEDTVYRWAKEHPTFSESKKIGWPKSKLMWEQMGIDGANGTLEKFNTGAWIFNLKNRFGWKDKTETELTTKIEINIDKDDSNL